jgi:hypothetical protein
MSKQKSKSETPKVKIGAGRTTTKPPVSLKPKDVKPKK